MAKVFNALNSGSGGVVDGAITSGEYEIGSTGRATVDLHDSDKGDLGGAVLKTEISTDAGGTYKPHRVDNQAVQYNINAEETTRVRWTLEQLKASPDVTLSVLGAAAV